MTLHNMPAISSKVSEWVSKIAALCKPDDVYFCDGSDEEFQKISDELVKNGTFIKLNEEQHPGSYLARSDAEDVARVEDRTFICSVNQEDSGPTNNWKDPVEMKTIMTGLYKGCMKGRRMYVIPFSMGPIGSDLSQIGIQITDSGYVVCNMKIMTRMGKEIWNILGNKDFIPCLHSVGKPLAEGEKDVPWPSNNQHKYIVHFPEEKSIWSFGSGYGGNALLGKKCLSLRIASSMAKNEGWLAEHMLILGITNPEGKKYYVAAAFPSACGKTNLAMMIPSLPDWKVECVGDDIAWLKFADDGKLYAINPEAGFFGVAPGTSKKTNPNAMLTLHKNCIFTNVAVTENKTVWWEGMTDQKPEKLIDWQGNDWTHLNSNPAAHPNARFTVAASQCPVIDEEWENPSGVPISVILFGGRRSSVIPLVHQAFDWNHGVFMGSVMSSETTAAASGKQGQLRRDPFAMLPFCGYNMADYFQHWINFGKNKDNFKLPEIFYVNWFSKDENNNYLWPGYGENSRVLKWIIERIEGKKDALSTAIGYIPFQNDIDISGLNGTTPDLQKLFDLDKERWLEEVEDIRIHFEKFGSKLPSELLRELEKLEERLKS